MSEKIEVFISYKHGKENHQRWVKKLATDLIEIYGIDCCVDQYDLKLGDSIHGHMQKIKTESSHVLFIITPEAVASIESNTGGIAFESQLSAALRDQKRLTVIPILKEGDQTAAYVADHLYIDFREDLSYKSNLKKLADNILGRAERPIPNSRKHERHNQIFQPGDMVLIPKGKFLYGDNKVEKDIPYDYYMDVFPVTNRQYKEFLDERKDYRDIRKHTFPEGMENHPVVEVSFHDAVEFCKWRSQKEGESYRLPTEEEWEKAARGTDGRIYPWGDEFAHWKCNTSELGIGKTTPVTDYPQGASPYKCQDMAGNVWEWTDSWYDEAKDAKVLRGGGWYGGRPFARCAYRFRFNPDTRLDYYGFRCARTL